MHYSSTFLVSTHADYVMSGICLLTVKATYFLYVAIHLWNSFFCAASYCGGTQIFYLAFVLILSHMTREGKENKATESAHDMSCARLCRLKDNVNRRDLGLVSMTRNAIWGQTPENRLRISSEPLGGVAEQVCRDETLLFFSFWFVVAVRIVKMESLVCLSARWLKGELEHKCSRWDRARFFVKWYDWARALQGPNLKESANHRCHGFPWNS